MSKWRELNALGACADTHCGLPAGFHRLRYFHGKQMRLADYVDEQAYHRGKMLLHNQRLHGSGILCGLKVTTMDPERTVLRVGRGAALDPCGREIVVPFDQCIDVDAWFRRQAYEFRDQDDNPCKPDQKNRVRICVLIRYAECKGGAEPAPPSPCGPVGDCGCGCGGSGACESGCDPCGEAAEFGRVSEQYELKLMFIDNAKAASETDLFPGRDDIDAALSAATGAMGPVRALTPTIRAGCGGPEDGWMVLACFYVTVSRDAPDTITGIEGIDYDCAAQVLLSTEVIQYLLDALYAQVDPDIGGPEITAISLRRLTEDKYQMVLRLSASIAPKTLESDQSFQLRALTPNGWRKPAGNALKAEYAEAIGGEFNVDGPAIYIGIDNSQNFLAEGGRYQLFAPEGIDPVTDTALRCLHPRHLTWRFGLAADPGTGALQMQPLAG